MPISKTKMKNAAIAARSAALPKIPKELLDQIVAGPMTGEAVNAASMAFKKALIERAMGAELGHHLGYPAGQAKPEPAANQRNGKSEPPRDLRRLISLRGLSHEEVTQVSTRSPRAGCAHGARAPG